MSFSTTSSHLHLLHYITFPSTCAVLVQRRSVNHRQSSTTTTAQRHESSQTTGELCRDLRRYDHNTTVLHCCRHRSTVVMSLPMLVTMEPPHHETSKAGAAISLPPIMDPYYQVPEHYPINLRSWLSGGYRDVERRVVVCRIEWKLQPAIVDRLSRNPEVSTNRLRACVTEHIFGETDEYMIFRRIGVT
ncbi:hypothetical protein YC2023_058115 [Brassica napus]